MELRNENTEKKRKRKLVNRGAVLVRSVKASGTGASFQGNENRPSAGLWRQA